QQTEKQLDARITVPVIAAIHGRCAGHVLHDYGEVVTAVATVFIAWFTLTLKRSTDKLWTAGSEALGVTERAFVYIDGFNPEITTQAEVIGIGPQTVIPVGPAGDPTLNVTRFAAQPRWKNSGSTPTKNLKIRADWSLGGNRTVG